MDTFYALRVTYILKVFFGQIHYGRLTFQTHQLLKKKKKLWPLQLIFTGADVERRLAEEPF